MDNVEFAKKLEKRTLDFAISIIKISAKIPDTIENRVVKRQIVKSGTSIGANYREANRAKSKPDFKQKINICEGEASETEYWLLILQETCSTNKNLFSEIITETKELLAIFTSNSRKLRKS